MPIKATRLLSLTSILGVLPGLLLVAAGNVCLANTSDEPPAQENLAIAFGSCLHQFKPQPVWQGILNSQPDLFVFAGDNVYTDRGRYRQLPEPERIGTAYQELANNPGFSELRSSVPILATWDDHDYGRNDAGADYPYREAAKGYFVDFFQLPTDSPVHQRQGIYHSHVQPVAGYRVQIILLDTRTFRSPLKRGWPSWHCPRTTLKANHDPDSTLLGADQWQWLASQLQQPADLRLLVSSIQVIPDSHCYEKWANFPHERQRLLALLQQQQTPVVIISGDRHHGDISRLTLANGDEIFEVTASGMNSTRFAAQEEENRYRVIDDNVRQDHFGWLHFQPASDQQWLTLEIRDVAGLNLQQLILARPQPTPMEQTD